MKNSSVNNEVPARRPIQINLGYVTCMLAAVTTAALVGAVATDGWTWVYTIGTATVGNGDLIENTMEAGPLKYCLSQKISGWNKADVSAKTCLEWNDGLEDLICSPESPASPKLQAQCTKWKAVIACLATAICSMIFGGLSSFIGVWRKPFQGVAIAFFAAGVLFTIPPFALWVGIHGVLRDSVEAVADAVLSYPAYSDRLSLSFGAAVTAFCFSGATLGMSILTVIKQRHADYAAIP